MAKTKIATKDEQKLHAAFFFTMVTLAEATKAAGLTEEVATYIFTTRAERDGGEPWKGFGDWTRDGEKMEFVPNKRWFNWIEKHPEQNTGAFDVKAIVAERDRRAAQAPAAPPVPVTPTAVPPAAVPVEPAVMQAAAPSRIVLIGDPTPRPDAKIILL
jgi:hypothetical protein